MLQDFAADKKVKLTVYEHDSEEQLAVVGAKFLMEKTDLVVKHGPGAKSMVSVGTLQGMVLLARSFANADPICHAVMPCAQGWSTFKQTHSVLQSLYKGTASVLGKQRRDIKDHPEYGPAYNNMKSALRIKGRR
jgi:hypothetical protein